MFCAQPKDAVRPLGHGVGSQCAVRHMYFWKPVGIDVKC